MSKKILLPTDGSDFAINASKHALFIASQTGTAVIAVSVVENGFVSTLPLEENVLEIEELLKSDCEQNLEQFKAIAESEYNVDIKYVIEEGSPAKAVLEVANREEVDLIVVGSSGKSGFDKFIMGSVADKIVNQAKCAVLVIH